jgi:iron(III) transport system ATP-binding protein
MKHPTLEPVGIEIRGVNLSYGTTHVLKDVNLDIAPGEFFAFLGPSGCGKTTLLRLIAGFNTSQTGTVKVGGGDISELPPWKRDVGMVFQSYALWPHMTVQRNVAFGLEERKVPRAEITARVKEALDIVGLGQLGERRPSQLSGGQQQRVALARTIVVRPKVLLLDEPLSNLDAKLRVQVRREIRDLQQSLGLTTIFVTHDQEEANTICDRIAVMNEGVIQQVGTPMDLYDNPVNLFVATFLGTANVLSGVIEGSGSDRRFMLSDGGVVPVMTNATVPARAKLLFRPQNASIIAQGSALPTGHARLSGKLAHREFLGSTVRYAISLGTSEVLVDSTHRGEAAIEVGRAVDIAVDLAKLQFLSD